MMIIIIIIIIIIIMMMMMMVIMILMMIMSPFTKENTPCSMACVLLKFTRSSSTQMP